MTPTEFVNLYNGKAIDWDGAYGVQCVDGFKVFCQWAGIPVKATTNGWANGYWIYRDQLEFYKWFDYITDTSQLRDGDWCIWDKGSSCPSSHIAMYYNGQYFGERQGGDNGFRLVYLQSDIMGALRWKGWSMLVGGYQETTYNGQRILVYKQTDEKIGMLSAGSNGYTVLPIEQIDDNHVNYCKINASYFQMQKDADDPYGTVYGVVESQNYSQEPRQNKFYVYGVRNDGSVIVCMDTDWWLSRNDVKFAVSPAVIMLLNGEEVEMLSPAIGYDKITNENTQSLLMRMGDGTYALACVVGKLNLYDTREWAKSIGAVDMIALDGGGSTQMHSTNGLYSTGRSIPNVIRLYKDKVEIPPDADTADSGAIPGQMDNLPPSGELKPEEPDIVIVDDPDDDYLFKMSDKMYDTLKFIVHIIPLLTILYISLAKTWDLPMSEQIVATIQAVMVFINAVLDKATIGYNANKEK